MAQRKKEGKDDSEKFLDAIGNGLVKGFNKLAKGAFKIGLQATQYTLKTAAKLMGSVIKTTANESYKLAKSGFNTLATEVNQALTQPKPVHETTHNHQISVPQSQPLPQQPLPQTAKRGFVSEDVPQTDLQLTISKLETHKAILEKQLIALKAEALGLVKKLGGREEAKTNPQVRLKIKSIVELRARIENCDQQLKNLQGIENAINTAKQQTVKTLPTKVIDNPRGQKNSNDPDDYDSSTSFRNSR